ncbi:MAG TPA: thermonuclease family protein [Candidatus Deferrimicrobium sp.]|nr:thermonuclease family protein [Candidatus Deferrimicrobium sp.]
MAIGYRTPRRRRRVVTGGMFVLLLAVIIVAVRLVEQIGLDRSPADRFTVKKIMDGDTMEFQGGDRLRLLSIDTPEKGERYYKEACEFLSDISLGKTARVEFAGARRDRYGRLLGYVYIDTIFVNKAILENGLGVLYLFKDNEFERPEIKELLAAQRVAMASQVGIWSVERQPEDFYVAVEGSFRFHRPACRDLGELRPDHHRILASREEALYDGLSPCRTCKP